MLSFGSMRYQTSRTKLVRWLFDFALFADYIRIIQAFNNFKISGYTTGAIMINCFMCTRGWLRPFPAFRDGLRCLTTRGPLAAAHGTNIKKRTQRRKTAAVEDTGQPQGVSFQTDNTAVYYCAKFKAKIVDVRMSVYRGYR